MRLPVVYPVCQSINTPKNVTARRNFDEQPPCRAPMMAVVIITIWIAAFLVASFLWALGHGSQGFLPMGAYRLYDQGILDDSLSRRPFC